MNTMGDWGLDWSYILSRLTTGGVTYCSPILPVTKLVMARYTRSTLKHLSSISCCRSERPSLYLPGYGEDSGLSKSNHYIWVGWKWMGWCAGKEKEKKRWSQLSNTSHIISASIMRVLLSLCLCYGNWRCRYSASYTSVHDTPRCSQNLELSAAAKKGF